MNNVSLAGRLTREPELRYGGQDNSTAITRFTLAVDDGKDTDFINIKCFGRTAEWAQKWLSGVKEWQQRKRKPKNRG
ncbi:single-stranded DNA-binding protein [Anaerobutyricum hallii]|uniref:single-stranded DNA-binding protein n=1 Tax=Anaerobutyricum hallii TaxID=39488 RepID=UPI001FD77EC6|nr:single-stranded DNA-binding protein [Anaerobutyricum hallii]